MSDLVHSLPEGLAFCPFCHTKRSETEGLYRLEATLPTVELFGFGPEHKEVTHDQILCTLAMILRFRGYKITNWWRFPLAYQKLEYRPRKLVTDQ